MPAGLAKAAGASDHVGRMIRTRRAWLFAAASFVLRSAPLVAQGDTLRYTFRYQPVGLDGPQLAVDVEFRGDRSGRTRVVEPSRWAGEDSLWRSIVSLEVAPGATVVSRDNGTLLVEHPPGAHVRLHYVLRQDWTGPLRYPVIHRPVLDGTCILFNQSNGLVFPSRSLGDTLVLQYRWIGLPSNWRILTSFSAEAGFSGPVTLREFAGASFAAGDLRLVSPPGGPGGVTVDAQGTWRFTDAALAQMVHSLWAAETRFWGAPAFGHAFVLLLPIANGSTLAGDAFTAGFVAAADSTADLDAVGRLLAHELFHLWNGQRLAAIETEARFKWFTEGITDYYADRIFRELGYYSDSAYRGHVNAVFRNYYSSPERGAALRDVAARFWTDQTVKRYPYVQGYAFALYLQANLPRWAGSRFDLDSLMVGLFRAAHGGSIEITDPLILSAAPAPARAPLAAAIGQYIGQGAMVPADSAALGRCVTVRTEPVYTFDLGFDGAASMRDRVIRGVRPDGPAARAGVPEGAKLTGFRWDPSEPSVPVLLQIDDGQGLREVRYLPQGSPVFLAPQYVPTPNAPGCLTLRP
jgi:predicted metalloprotease with PDZ domain